MDRKLKIMIIEDEEMLLFAINKKMENVGIETKSFATAREALDFLSTSQDLPDVIWLDYYLKDMNGIEFMHELKKNEKHANIPVVVVSNSANDEKVSAMIAMGVKKYFLKADHRLEEMIEEIRKLV